MDGIELAQALRDGRRVYGTCVVSSAPQWPGMIASSGLDFVFIDTEHIVHDRSTLAWMCQAYGAMDLVPIVRIPSPDPYLACQMVDMGAKGVIAPYVESVGQVRELRGAVKLRPLKGERLHSVLDGSVPLSAEEQHYLQQYNRGNLCIVNVESVPAMKRLDEILAVPDVDSLLIGPHDLSINLGVPEQYDHPKFREAVETVVQKARSAGVGVGMHYSGPDALDRMADWAEIGMNLLIYSSDLFLMKHTLGKDIADLRIRLNDSDSYLAGAVDDEFHV